MDWDIPFQKILIPNQSHVENKSFNTTLNIKNKNKIKTYLYI